MALRRLLQPNSTLRLCRLGFSAARERFCSSASSVGDTDSPAQLKDVDAKEDMKIMTLVDLSEDAMEAELGLPKETSLENIAGRDSLCKPKTLSNLFTTHKDDSTETAAESEEREGEETLLDYNTKNYELDTNESRSFAFASNSQSSKVHEEDAEKKSINNSSECIGLQNATHNPTKQLSNMGLIKDNLLHANAERCDKHDRSNLPEFPAGISVVEAKKEQREGPKASMPTSNNDQRQREKKDSSRTESEGNRVLVRFLRSSVTKSQLVKFFSACGKILKIECHNAQGSLFKTCHIDFETREGFEKAISRSGLDFHGPIVVESASSENTTTRIPIPSLLGDPDIPAALVKNPTRTIRIEQLTQEMNSHHIIEALTFCKSNVSGYFMGSSPSVAYVEFQTEIGKERALAKQSINVLGKHLVMLRIDCPRTTAVRILSTSSFETNDAVSICKSLGTIYSYSQRAPNMVDVQFKLYEWPNMLNILNRLNGHKVEGGVLQAAPAPIFHPEVLLALWPHPEERKHLKATAQALLHSFGSTWDLSELALLENDLFSM